jgi:Flp pilus assembly protein protease CpaA
MSAVCAYTDVRRGLLLNKITVPMAALGLIYSALSGKIAVSLAGLAVGFGFFLIPVLLGGAGAGDAKMSGALGAWLGIGIIQAIFIASVIGLIWGVIRLHRAGALKSRASLFFRGAYYRLVYGMRGVVPLVRLPDGGGASAAPGAIPFGACLAAGAWAVILGAMLWR